LEIETAIYGAGFQYIDRSEIVMQTNIDKYEQTDYTLGHFIRAIVTF